MTHRKLPELIQAIEDHRCVNWADDGPEAQFREYFDETRIPVAGTRHIRIWGLDAYDDSSMPRGENFSFPVEKLGQIELIAKDGSRHEVNASMVRAPDGYPSKVN